MIALDTQILVYAHRRDSPWHQAAYESVRGLAEGSHPWAIPWPCLHEFVSIVTHPKIYRPPTPTALALDQVADLLDAPRLELLSESRGHWDRLAPLARAGRIRGPKIHDARIAALCLHHGVRELWTSDRDFSRFPALRTHNPLIEASN